MSHDPKPLIFENFDKNTFLLGTTQAQQLEYIRKYLSDGGLNAKKVIIEPNFFDRDFLSEFSEFYSTSTHSYENICRRYHLFESDKVDEKLFTKALKNNLAAVKTLQDSYLGFIVVRPFPHAPLGKTVLKWYPDNKPLKKRVTKTSRLYKVNIASVRLEVAGLAWQQQDEGISSCATIALWTLLHSSAYNEYRTIPTTAEITLLAHHNYSEGRHPFPSLGLTTNQICDAIIQNGLRPAVYQGETEIEVEQTNYKPAFSKKLFSHVCASFLRSGFPILLVGKQFEKTATGNRSYDHTVCLVGYRENNLNGGGKKFPSQHDENIKYIYVHDDNLGPNVRFEIKKNDLGVFLSPSAPLKKNKPALFDRYDKFVPIQIITAVNTDLRVAPEDLYHKGFNIADKFLEIWKTNLGGSHQVSFGIQYLKLTDYYTKELNNLIGSQKKDLLAKTRLSLLQDVQPLSKYVGLIRIALNGFTVFDVLCDTSQVKPIPYATICLHSQVQTALVTLETSLQEQLGETLRAHLDV